MRPLAVCLLGGTGFVGSRLAARLSRDGHRVTVLSRDRERHKELRVVPGIAVENCDVYDEPALAERFRGQDVVVNLVGILNESGFGGGGFRRTHVALTRAALQAANSAHVRRFIQVSSLGADAAAPSHYLRTKAEAEAVIAAECGRVDWTVLRPSVIFGPGDSFLNRFAGLLRALPLAFPLARPAARLQPIHVDDVVEACVRCLSGGACSRRIYELGGPQVFTLRGIVTFVAGVTGQRRLVIGLPDPMARLQALLMDFVPGRPFSTDNYRSLTVDSVVRDDGCAALGIRPQAMEAAARQYLGAFEDNARLGRDRRLAGR